MTANQDYIDFRDSVIVAIADEQEPPGLGAVEIYSLCERHGIEAGDTWKEAVGGDMDKLGWGRDVSTLKSRQFLINGAGLARAAEVRLARRPKPLSERLQTIPRSDWIALGAFLTSLIALFK